MYKWIPLLLATGLLLAWKVLPQPIATYTPETPVAEVLFALGKEKPLHFMEQPDSAMIQRGKELVHEGKTTKPEGGRSGYISKYYQCTSCHTIQREDPDLTKSDVEAKLTHAMEHQIPFLQGSTFWGIVNRETWYNDDYYKKYGDLVIKAKNSLAESTQLCAEVCAQGRRLKDWELESVLAYFWSLQLTLSDLALTEADWELLRGSGSDADKRAMLESKFLPKSPATFGEVPEDKEKGYSYTGRPDRGKALYELGCQHCHAEAGESDVVLDNSKVTFRWLKRNITDNSQLSLYEIIRIGTYSEAGHKEYMPHYTEEKMSDQQVEDLRAYVEQEAE